MFSFVSSQTFSDISSFNIYAKIIRVWNKWNKWNKCHGEVFNHYFHRLWSLNMDIYWALTFGMDWLWTWQWSCLYVYLCVVQSCLPQWSFFEPMLISLLPNMCRTACTQIKMQMINISWIIRQILSAASIQTCTAKFSLINKKSRRKFVSGMITHLLYRT